MTFAIAPTIRLARAEDMPHLPRIEQAAAALFRGTAYGAIANSDPTPWNLDTPRQWIWVAVDPLDRPMAFAVVRRLTEGPHLQEIDVDPLYARHGIGRCLIEAIAAWATAQGDTTLTLCTFCHIPWNAPYYARLGFRPLEVSALSPALRAIRNAEAEMGLSATDRCCMQRDL